MPVSMAERPILTWHRAEPLGRRSPTEPRGFSNWGNPGWTKDYDDGFIGGTLVGNGFVVGGIPLGVELSGTFGDLSSKTSAQPRSSLLSAIDL